ncbi:MAG: hypothetical protein IPM38_03755 [Ignavibacteria bacterium]|nr:hypothetical protein [Ignavibacteria bacterium]
MSKDNTVTRRGDNSGQNPLRYLTGLDGYALNNRGPYGGYFELIPDLSGNQYSKWLLLGNDASHNNDLDGLFGYGKYIFEIYTTSNSGYSFDSICAIPIDWNDFNYNYITGSGGSQDLFLKIYSLSPLSITFQWGATIEGDELPLFGTGSPPYDGSIVYKQYHRFDTITNQWTGYNLNNEHPPSRGSSVTDENYLIFPIDGRELPSPYTIPYHPNSGDLFGNVFVDDTIATKNILLDTITNITVKKKAAMIIKSGNTFNMITPSFGYNNLIVEDTATLVLNSNGKIKVNYPNRITLKYQSNLTFHPNSEMRFINGGSFCNEGGKVRGPGNFIFEKGLHGFCPGIDNIFLVKDSTKIILEDSAVVILPNNYNLHLRGNTTSLIMKPGSKMMFGENSGIVCDSGAKLIANNAVFTPDSTKKERYSLKHRSQDTIKTPN